MQIQLNFSAYSAYRQLLIFICLFFISYFCFFFVVALLSALGVPLVYTTYAGLVFLLLGGQFFSFFLPAWFWGYYYTAQPTFVNLQLRGVPSDRIGGALLLCVFAIPAAYFWEELNAALLFSKWMEGVRPFVLSKEKQVVDLLKPLFAAKDVPHIITTFLLIALVPACAEELFFRAGLLPILYRISGRKHSAIWISACIFALFHAQFLGFFPRFFLGVVLGHLFFYTGSLLAPFLFHAMFNGLQVGAVFFLGVQLEEDLQRQPHMLILWIGAAALIIYGLLLRRLTQKQIGSYPKHG